MGGGEVNSSQNLDKALVWAGHGVDLSCGCGIGDHFTARLMFKDHALVFFGPFPYKLNCGGDSRRTRLHLTLQSLQTQEDKQTFLIPVFLSFLRTEVKQRSVLSSGPPPVLSVFVALC